MAYRDDNEAMLYKRISDLEDEARKLREQTIPSKVTREFKLKVPPESVLAWAAFLAGLAVFCGLFWIVAQKVLSDDRVEYCYTHEAAPNNATPIYYLKGYRRWTEDLYLSRHDSLDNAVKAANELKCPLLKR